MADNALKHGLMAREVVIRAGDGSEDPEEFDAMFRNRYEEPDAVGGTRVLTLGNPGTCRDCLYLVPTHKNHLERSLASTSASPS